MDPRHAHKRDEKEGFEDDSSFLDPLGSIKSRQSPGQLPPVSQAEINLSEETSFFDATPRERRTAWGGHRPLTITENDVTEVSELRDPEVYKASGEEESIQKKHSVEGTEVSEQRVGKEDGEAGDEDDCALSDIGGHPEEKEEMLGGLLENLLGDSEDEQEAASLFGGLLTRGASASVSIRPSVVRPSLNLAALPLSDRLSLPVYSVAPAFPANNSSTTLESAFTLVLDSTLSSTEANLDTESTSLSYSPSTIPQFSSSSSFPSSSSPVSSILSPDSPDEENQNHDVMDDGGTSIEIKRDMNLNNESNSLRSTHTIVQHEHEPATSQNRNNNKGNENEQLVQAVRDSPSSRQSRRISAPVDVKAALTTIMISTAAQGVPEPARQWPNGIEPTGAGAVNVLACTTEVASNKPEIQTSSEPTKHTREIYLDNPAKKQSPKKSEEPSKQSTEISNPSEDAGYHPTHKLLVDENNNTEVSTSEPEAAQATRVMVSKAVLEEDSGEREAEDSVSSLSVIRLMSRGAGFLAGSVPQGPAAPGAAEVKQLRGVSFAPTLATTHTFQAEGSPSSAPPIILSTGNAGKGGVGTANASDKLPIRLEEILDTPQYCYVLADYLRKNLCSENIEFLLAARAYTEISDPAKFKENAERIIDQFIGPNAPALINLPGPIRKDLFAAAGRGAFDNKFFDRAYGNIYHMTEEDVFRRFVQSREYKAMVTEYQRVSVFKSQRQLWRLRPESFAVIAETENRGSLGKLLSEFRATLDALEDPGPDYRKELGVTWFKGQSLVEWVIKHKQASLVQAVSVGQRLCDARLVTGDKATDFTTGEWYAFERQVVGHLNASAILDREDLGEEGITAGPVLLRGLKYNSCFLVFRAEADTLYFFHDHTSKFPHTVVTDCWVRLEVIVQLSDTTDTTYIHLKFRPGYSLLQQALAPGTEGSRGNDGNAGSTRNQPIMTSLAAGGALSSPQILPEKHSTTSPPLSPKNLPQPISQASMKVTSSSTKTGTGGKFFSKSMKSKLESSNKNSLKASPNVTTTSEPINTEHRVENQGSFSMKSGGGALQVELRVDEPDAREMWLKAFVDADIALNYVDDKGKSLDKLERRRIVIHWQDHHQQQLQLQQTQPSESLFNPQVSSYRPRRDLPSRNKPENDGLKRAVLAARGVWWGSPPPTLPLPPPPSGIPGGAGVEAGIWRMRQQLVDDMLATEDHFVTDFKAFITFYLQPMVEQTGLVDSEAGQNLLTSAQGILRLHTRLHTDWHNCRAKKSAHAMATNTISPHIYFLTAMGDFLDGAHNKHNSTNTDPTLGGGHYSNYIRQYPLLMLIDFNIDEHVNPKMRVFLEEAKKKHFTSLVEYYHQKGLPLQQVQLQAQASMLDLPSLAILPLQRVKAYIQFFDRLHKLTGTSGTSSPTSISMGFQFASAAKQFSLLLQSCCVKLEHMWQRLEPTHFSAYRSAQLLSIDKRLSGVPDDWKVLSPDRCLVAEGVLFLLYAPPPSLEETNRDGEKEGKDKEKERERMSDFFKPPHSHPHKDKRGESVRVYVFDDCLLVTTWQHRYQLRLELNEFTVVKTREDVVFACLPEMFQDTESIAEGHAGSAPNDAAFHIDSTSTTFLMARDVDNAKEWVERIQAQTTLRRKQLRDILLRNQDAPKGRKISKVNLFMRVRPFVTKEEHELARHCIRTEGNVVTLDQSSLDSSRPERVASYDRVFGPDAVQEDVFRGIGTEVLGAVVCGLSIAVMCYGNTGAGKTHTMFGNITDPQQKGIVPRLLEALFALLEQEEKEEPSLAIKDRDKTDKEKKDKDKVTVQLSSPSSPKSSKMSSQQKVFISYVQVYNDKIQDLQHPSLPELTLKQVKSGSGTFTTGASSGGSVQLKGLTKTHVHNVHESLEIVRKGNKLRTTRGHSMNDSSSRSHAVFILEVHAVRRGKKSVSTVHLVDLAGSENVKLTRVDQNKEALQESREINKSLISLGRVINALNENRKRPKDRQLPVPFRETKLTHMLTDVLEGEFLCSLILNASLSPAQGQAQQTGKTMAFGESVKKLTRRQEQQEDQKLNQWLSGVWNAAKRGVGI